METINQSVVSLRKRNPTSKERHEFIDFIFQELKEIRVRSKNELAKELIKRYRDQYGININKEWCYALIRYGIYKNENGEVLFSENVPYSVNDLCDKPSLIRRGGENVVYLYSYEYVKSIFLRKRCVCIWNLR